MRHTRITIGYEFGKSTESYLKPIIVDSEDHEEVSRKMQWVKDHPEATNTWNRITRCREMEVGGFDPDPEGIYR